MDAVTAYLELFLISLIDESPPLRQDNETSIIGIYVKAVCRVLLYTFVGVI